MNFFFKKLHNSSKSSIFAAKLRTYAYPTEIGFVAGEAAAQQSEKAAPAAAVVLGIDVALQRALPALRQRLRGLGGDARYAGGGFPARDRYGGHAACQSPRGARDHLRRRTPDAQGPGGCGARPHAARLSLGHGDQRFGADGEEIP